MEKKEICPICKRKANIDVWVGLITINCDSCGIVKFEPDIWELFNSRTNESYKFRSCLHYFMTQVRKNSGKGLLLAKNSIIKDNSENNIKTLEEILSYYPKNLNDRINKVLLNLSNLEPEIGKDIRIESQDLFSKILFIEYDLFVKNIYFPNFIQFLMDANFLKRVSRDINSSINIFRIAPKGWERIAEIQKNNLTNKQGFIAMSFSEKNHDLRQSIKNAIISAGYDPRLIDEKEYNGQIVPEIFYEISQSDFVVADLTDNRGGVYLEAGYALGLNKDVIFTVDNHYVEGNELHFDVDQMNQIRYQNLKDLEKRLKERIVSTINNHRKDK